MKPAAPVINTFIFVPLPRSSSFLQRLEVPAHSNSAPAFNIDALALPEVRTQSFPFGKPPLKQFSFERYLAFRRNPRKHLAGYKVNARVDVSREFTFFLLHEMYDPAICADRHGTAVGSAVDRDHQHRQVGGLYLKIGYERARSALV